MATVSTDYYEFSHGTRPRGRGTWAFAPSTSGRRVPAEDAPITWAPGNLLYSEAKATLPAGEWIALP